jgi:MYXO-CTERM domain-containing protein
MTKSKIFAAVIAATAFVSSAASASVFAIDYHDAGVWNAYDAGNETYGMKFRSDLGNDGFWLVVTDGDNPKGDGSTNAILYGDLVNNRITAYTYNGENNANSFETGQLLGTYENVFSSGGQHHRYGYDMTMFNLDVAGINNAFGPDFDGVTIGEDAGIWFHQSEGSNFTYGADGSILDYTFTDQTWLDRGNDAAREFSMVNCATGGVNPDRFAPTYLDSCGATQISGGGVVGSSSGGGSVPAPGGLALVLVGLAGLGRMRRRNKT